MKKLAIVLTAAMAVACTSEAQISYGVHGDIITTKIAYKADNDINSYGDFDKARISFRAGIIASTPITENIVFMPQLNFVSGGGTLKGDEKYTEDGETVNYSFKEKLVANFIELPLNVAYTSTLSNGSRFYAGAGPFLQLGIGGKYTVKGSEQVTGGPAEKFTDKGKVKFDGKKYDELSYNDYDVHFKRMNVGASLFAAYELQKGLFVKASYMHGFSNLSPDAGEKAKTRQFGIGMGYMLGSL